MFKGLPWFVPGTELNLTNAHQQSATKPSGSVHKIKCNGRTVTTPHVSLCKHQYCAVIRNKNQIMYVLNCSSAYPMFALPPYLELLTYKVSYAVFIYVCVLCPYKKSDSQLQFSLSYTCDRQLNTTSARSQYYSASCENTSLHISGSQPVFSRGSPWHDWSATRLF